MLFYSHEHLLCVSDGLGRIDVAFPPKIGRVAVCHKHHGGQEQGMPQIPGRKLGEPNFID